MPVKPRDNFLVRWATADRHNLDVNSLSPFLLEGEFYRVVVVEKVQRKWLVRFEDRQTCVLGAKAFSPLDLVQGLGVIAAADQTEFLDNDDIES